MYPITFLNLLVVAIGGALGALGRFVLTSWVHGKWGTGFPWGTLSVNLIGSLVAGLVFGFLLQRQMLQQAPQLFLMVGVLGAFTTFSAFSLDSIRLLENGVVGLALTSITANLLGCLLVTWVGIQVAKFI